MIILNALIDQLLDLLLSLAPEFAAMEAVFLESEEFKQQMSVKLQNHNREEYVRNYTNYCT